MFATGDRQPIRFDGLHGCDWFTSTVNRSADCG
ncbi:Uncharacterised protein [Vibrio cholerae]|nr:Uncharacterised protein [Vibrio cholerae]